MSENYFKKTGILITSITAIIGFIYFIGDITGQAENDSGKLLIFYVLISLAIYFIFHYESKDKSLSFLLVIGLLGIGFFILSLFIQDDSIFKTINAFIYLIPIFLYLLPVFKIIFQKFSKRIKNIHFKWNRRITWVLIAVVILGLGITIAIGAFSSSDGEIIRPDNDGIAMYKENEITLKRLIRKTIDERNIAKYKDSLELYLVNGVHTDVVFIVDKDSISMKSFIFLYDKDKLKNAEVSSVTFEIENIKNLKYEKLYFK